MKSKNEKGEVVVEASIIVTLVVTFITLMLYVGMILYQKTLITVMANQTASNIAQVYSNNLKDPFTGYVDPDRVYQSITYSNLKTDAYMDVVNQKANVMGQYRLKSSRILATGATTVDVDIVKKPNELLKSQIVVTIHDKYDIPLVDLFGVNSGIVEFSAKGRADCVDVLEYLNGVEAIGDPENSTVPSLPESDTCLVTFVTDKYSGGLHAVVPVLRGKSMITSNHYSHCEMPDNPQYNDMEFTGWVTENGSVFTASQQVDKNITVYGTWLCLVTFEPEGGTVNPTSKKVELKKTTDLPNPNKSGYAFEGWYTEKDGGGVRYYSNVTEITGNITLYAKWRCTHDFKATRVSSGDCQHKSRWKYTCIRCPYSYEADGAFGSCVKGNGMTTVNPSCTAKGEKIYKCTVCSKVMESVSTKALGHNFEKYERAATCAKEGLSGKKCSRCGLEEGKKIAKLDHVWDGRCGKAHDLGADAYVMEKHNKSNGYTLTTWGECYLCKNCGAPYGGWVTRNGQKVSKGMLCRKHNDNSGKNKKDSAFSDNDNLHLHD